MKVDLYTKSILTVIAVALIALFFKNGNIVNEAQAEKVNYNKYASIPLNPDGSINVKLISDMDVNIRSIGGSSVYGSIPINLKEIGGSSFYGSLPVNLKEYGGNSLNSNGIPVNVEAVDGNSLFGSVPVKIK